MVCTSLGSLLRPLFYFLCYIHFSLGVEKKDYDRLRVGYPRMQVPSTNTSPSTSSQEVDWLMPAVSYLMGS